jgi:hypothetical protein
VVLYSMYICSSGVLLALTQIFPWFPPAFRQRHDATEGRRSSYGAPRCCFTTCCAADRTCVCVCVCLCVCVHRHRHTHRHRHRHRHTTHTHTHTHSLTQPSTPCGESAAATAAVPGILVILRDAAAAASLSIRAIVELPAAAV